MIKRRLVIETGASYQVGLITCMFFAIPKRLIIKALTLPQMAGLHRSWCFSAIGAPIPVSEPVTPAAPLFFAPSVVGQALGCQSDRSSDAVFRHFTMTSS